MKFKIIVTLSLLLSLIIFISYPYIFSKTYINANEPNGMVISFFVEYPEIELDNVGLIDFPTKLYIAAPSIKDFNRIKPKIKNKNVTEIIYWPILNESAGYWLSPFTESGALLDTLNEINGTEVLWDAELPKRKYQVITRLFSFFQNKRKIENHFKNNPGMIYTAEYFPFSGLLEFFGLSFSPNKFGNKMIKMVYSSMHNYPEYIVQKEIAYGKSIYGENFIVGLGTLATGIKGNEPRIRPEILERDLNIAKKAGVKEIVIYRLGGLDPEYLKIIKKYNRQS